MLQQPYRIASIFALCVSLAGAQGLAPSYSAPLTNETIIRLVASGVPIETVVNTIRGTNSVNFSFLPGDLELLQRYHVPDDVVKAMAAKSAGKPIPAQESVQPLQARPPQVQNGTGTRKAEPGLTNESIVKLVKAGMTEDVVLGMVNTQPGQYSLGTEDVIALKQAGVGQKVIAAMISKPPAGGSGGSVSNVSIPDTPSTSLVNEFGIYVKRGNSWDEVVPEPINWKTGGVVKHVATVGLIKGDRNGSLAGPGSRNVITLPAEFLIYTREAESYGEYILTRLHQNNDSREFRVFTGGVFHEKGGAQRDLITYEAVKVAPRTYHFVLKDMETGEYGFLPPNLLTTTSASAQLGKMFTFRVRE
jgi:hypothetical protein